MGTFDKLLMAVSKDPAMLQFLNNQQNKKNHPNENFAREVMELFTLGRENYSEEDVKEAARALLGGGSLLVPQFLKAFEGRRFQDSSDRILIIVQLSGGNDGLNTVVPFHNDLYYQLRPTLGIAKEKVLKASDELGFNPALLKFKELYDQGLVTVINNVGYPNPDRSHFRSMDIWQTASKSNEYLTTGWIGRYLDSNCPDSLVGHQGQDCGSHTAVEIDDSLSLALRGEIVKGMAIKDPAKLYKAWPTRAFAHSLF